MSTIHLWALEVTKDIHLGIHNIVQLDAKLKIQCLQNKNKFKNGSKMS